MGNGKPYHWSIFKEGPVCVYIREIVQPCCIVLHLRLHLLHPPPLVTDTTIAFSGYIHTSCPGPALARPLKQGPPLSKAFGARPTPFKGLAHLHLGRGSET